MQQRSAFHSAADSFLLSLLAGLWRRVRHLCDGMMTRGKIAIMTTMP